jgi:serralysin
LFNTAGKQLTATPVARHNFFAWESTFRGGVTVAVGDVNADGRGDIVVGQGPGAGGVRAFSGTNGTTLLDLKPFGNTFDLGVSVGVGDVNGDGKADVITGAMRGDANVKVFSGDSQIAAYSAFSGKVGTRVAVQDIDGDGKVEVLVAASGGAPSVKVLNGMTGTVKRAFPAMTPNYTSGLSVG